MKRPIRQNDQRGQGFLGRTPLRTAALAVLAFLPYAQTGGHD